MANDSTVVLKVDKIRKRFGETEAIKQLSLEIHRGEIFTLLGPSGCGKSTTLRMIAGLEHPDSGKISLNGEIIVDADAQKFTPPEKRNMGMVFQAFAVWPHMTVFANVAFPLRLRRESRASTRKKAMEALELVGLTDRAEEYPWQLSGGMQQRLALARAIVYAPDVLLLDEPLSNLDAKLREQMRTELRSLQRKLGTTFVFVTHDQAEAMSLSTRIAVMSEGKVEQIGSPVDVYDCPSSAFVRDFLGTTLLFSGRVQHRDACPSVALDLGAQVPVPDGTSTPANGGRVLLACRAESIRILPGKDRGDDRIAAVIEEATYIGDRTDYAIRAGDRLLSLCCHDEIRYDVGTRVNLGFVRKGITVWPDDD